MDVKEAIEQLEKVRGVMAGKVSAGTVQGAIDWAKEDLAFCMAIEAIKMVDQIKVECEFAKKYERGRCKAFADHLLNVIEMEVE